VGKSEGCEQQMKKREAYLVGIFSRVGSRAAYPMARDKHKRGLSCIAQAFAPIHAKMSRELSAVCRLEWRTSTGVRYHDIAKNLARRFFWLKTFFSGLFGNKQRIMIYRMAKVGILDRITPEFGVVKFA